MNRNPDSEAIRAMLYDFEGKQRLPKFSSVGCYPLFYMTERGEALCSKCATFEVTRDSQPDDPVSYCEVNWEDPEFYCDDCSERIESAYAEPEVTS